LENPKSGENLLEQKKKKRDSTRGTLKGSLNSDRAKLVHIRSRRERKDGLLGGEKILGSNEKSKRGMASL